MGDVSGMMLDGTLCEQCGVYVGDPLGFPRKCRDCNTAGKMARLVAGLEAAKVSCPKCGKRVKAMGLADHLRDAHP